MFRGKGFKQQFYHMSGSLLQDTRYTGITADFADTAEGYARQTRIPKNGHLKNLHIKLDAAPTAGSTRTFVVRINGVDKTITCTISNSETEASDVTHVEAVSKGDVVSIKSTISVAPSSAGFAGTLEYVMS